MKTKLFFIMILTAFMLKASDAIACKNKEISTNIQSIYDERNCIPILNINDFHGDSIRIDSADNIVDLTADMEIVKIDDAIIHFGGPEPSFPGGDEMLGKFLSDNVNNNLFCSLTTPVSKSTVYVQFIIDEEGNAVEECIIKGEVQALNDEALRLVRIMPKWEVGAINGKKYRTTYTLPIHFYLN